MTRDKNQTLKVRQGSVKREHSSQTYKSHGYNCHPVNIINQHGWEFVLPHDVTVFWDGISDSDQSHVKILNGETYNGRVFVTSETANATVTFKTGYFVETDPDHYLLLSGSPNTFMDGAMPMNALWRSDYYNYNELIFCWKMTKPNQEVVFKEGTSILFVMNYPKGLLESTDISIDNLSEDMEKRIGNYAEKRSNFYKENEPWKWGNFYRNGIGPYDEKHLDSVFRINLREP